MSLTDTVQKLAEGREFNLRKGQYSLVKTSFQNNNFRVYEVETKRDPTWDSNGKKVVDESWSHSTVIRLSKLPNDEEKIRGLFDQFQIRKSITKDQCPSLVTFHDQGIFQYHDELYYAIRYDEPFRDYAYWINVDHQGTEIDALDVYRLARGSLEVFAYLEENGYVLTQYDEHNVYATSLSEDRANFFRVMFKGHKDKSAPFTALQRRHRFAPPETESKEIYKSYSFTMGLLMIWGILATNNKLGEFPDNIHSNTGGIDALIKSAVSTLYKEGSANQQQREALQVFLEEVLQADIGKRKSAKELLTFKWIVESDKLDYEEYKKECDEYEKAVAKEKEENEKNA